MARQAAAGADSIVVTGTGRAGAAPDALIIDLRLDGHGRTVTDALVETWQAEYGADSPAALREVTAQAETAEETREMRQTANDWDIVAYRLRLVADAIEHYADYAGSPPTPA